MGSSLGFGGLPYFAASPRDAQLDRGRRPWNPALHLRVLIRRFRLDRQLAGGASPKETAELSLRARQLQDRRLRQTLANTLERDIELTERHPSRAGSNHPFDKDEVARSRTLLMKILVRLRESGPIPPQGVAMVNWLLSDAASPMFSPGWRTVKSAPGTLELHARAILDIFDGRSVVLPAGLRFQPQRTDG